MRAAAIVPAAGKGIRIQSHIPKVLIPLLGKPMLLWTLERIQQSALFSTVLVACPPGEEQAFQESLAAAQPRIPVSFVAGGETRQDSVAHCLAVLPDDCDLVAVHDGARPLVSETLLRDTLQTAARTGAAVAAVPCKDTVKLYNERGIIVQTLERERLLSVQTPQCFTAEIIKAAYERAGRDGFSATDDSAIVERLGVEVHVVTGSYENIKVTTPEDIVVCEEFLRRRYLPCG